MSTQCHSSESWKPGGKGTTFKPWVPAYAGMTVI